MANKKGGRSFRRYDFKHNASLELGKVYNAGINDMRRRRDAVAANQEGTQIFFSDSKLDDIIKFEINRVRDDTQSPRSTGNMSGRRLVLQESI